MHGYCSITKTRPVPTLGSASYYLIMELLDKYMSIPAVGQESIPRSQGILLNLLFRDQCKDEHGKRPKEARQPLTGLRGEKRTQRVCRSLDWSIKWPTKHGDITASGANMANHDSSRTAPCGGRLEKAVADKVDSCKPAFFTLIVLGNFNHAM